MSIVSAMKEAAHVATFGLFRGRTPLNQHLAVFGESGNGKTTLLSAFYGWQQEPAFRKNFGYGLTAFDTTVGQRLRSAYLKMSNDLLPPPTRYAHEAVEFDLYVEGVRRSPGKLVWHDYPGGWWTESRQGEEQERNGLPPSKKSKRKAGSNALPCLAATGARTAS